jgi:flagellar biosynthesis anti-sigma factor FlgM
MRIEAAVMQPDAVTRARRVAQAADSPPPRQVPDSIELSRRREQLLRAAEAAVQAENARAQRLAELQAQIRGGSYQVDGAAVAKELLRHD